MSIKNETIMTTCFLSELVRFDFLNNKAPRSYIFAEILQGKPCLPNESEFYLRASEPCKILKIARNFAQRNCGWKPYLEVKKIQFFVLSKID